MLRVHINAIWEHAQGTANQHRRLMYLREQIQSVKAEITEAMPESVEISLRQVEARIEADAEKLLALGRAAERTGERYGNCEQTVIRQAEDGFIRPITAQVQQVGIGELLRDSALKEINII